MLRHDPDIIMVGEMRDPETAEIGLRAAITGHLVLSTLHTRDTISTPFRLLDMGAPPFMVASSLQAVISQRLLRSVCENCREPHLPTPQEGAWLLAVGGEAAVGLKNLRGRGCSSCNGTGYSGRVGVYEMLEMDAPLAQAATSADPGNFSRLAREQLKGRMLAHRALDLVKAGRTSVAEAMRLDVDSA
jgi:MSHA biogenesis protein MshE